MKKESISDLAILGGKPLFVEPRSTSNLVRPDIESFLDYSRKFYAAQQYSNNGPLVRELEGRLAQLHETRYCIAFCSGFWALVLAMKALAQPERTEIVMPSLTYRRMADVAAWAGLTPRYCDVAPDTLAPTIEMMESCINDQTALLLAVHPIVNCGDVHGIEQLARTHRLPLLIDAVESVYETSGGRKVGGFGNAECFSMHASKLINGFEGGYITTNDAHLAERLARLRGFGFYAQDSLLELGMNAKLNEVHAALALAALDDLEEQVTRNRDRYRVYQRELSLLQGLRLLEFDESEKTSFKNIVIELKDEWPLSRAQTLAVLHSENILARPYYSPALHQKKTHYPTLHGELPNTEDLAERFILLPCGHFISSDDIEQVVSLLHFLRNHAKQIQSSMQV